MLASALVLLILAQAPPAFRADVALVRVDAEVTDGLRPITGLARPDFEVFDNGERRTILHCSEAEEPLDVILLFDISGSMRPIVEKVAESARLALAELQPGDRVAVMIFSNASRLIAPFTDDLDAAERTVRDDVLALKFRGGTRILAAVDNAALYFLREPKSQRRRSVLLITDNYGMRSRRESTVVTRMWEADASLSGLIIRGGLGDRMRRTNRVIAPHSLLFEQSMNGTADKTGGEAIQARDPGPAFREMMRRLRRRYTLYYAMPEGKPGETRQVRVALNAESKRRFADPRVRARKGYRIP